MIITLGGKTSIGSCRRCDEPHDDLEWRAFRNPPRVGRYQVAIEAWARCPLTGDPLLIFDKPQPGDASETA